MTFRIVRRKLVFVIAEILALSSMLLSVAKAQQPTAEASPTRLVSLSYPRLAHLAGVQGRVELVANISSNGTVQKVQVISGDSILAKAATESVLRWHFAGCNANVRECQAKMVFIFVLSGECDITSCPSEVQFDLPGTVTVRSHLPHAIID